MYKVDWIEYTIFQDFENDAYLFELLKKTLPKNVMMDLEINKRNLDYEIGIGKYGYMRSYNFFNGLIVYTHGHNKLHDMGIHVSICGSLLDSCSEECSREVLSDFLKSLEDNHCKLTRLDIALDTDCDFSFFLERFEKGYFLTKFRKFRTILDEHKRGTIYLGQRGKAVFGRIYDKGLEQGKNEVWTRIEFEYKSFAALQAANAFIDGSIGDYFLGHIRFVDGFNGENKSRDYEESEVYMNVLMHPTMIKRLKKSVFEDGYTQWLYNSVLPSIKAMYELYGENWLRLALESSEVSESRKAKLKRELSELSRQRDNGKLNERDIDYLEFYEQLSLLNTAI